MVYFHTATDDATPFLHLSKAMTATGSSDSTLYGRPSDLKCSGLLHCEQILPAVAVVTLRQHH